MTKAGAIAILTTVFMGLFAWAGNEIIGLKTKSVELQINRDDIKEDIVEIKSDVKAIKRMLQRRN